MKKRLLGFTVLLASGIAWFVLTHRIAPAPYVASHQVQQAAIQAALSETRPQVAAAIETAFAPASSAIEAAVQQRLVSAQAARPTAETFTSLPPEMVMANVRQALRDYALRFGGNPVGTNQEITRALNGDNLRQVNFLNEEAGVRINEKGELVDPWGVPFFLHQLAAREMEIRSAGPDRAMWTEDDLVIK